MNGLYIPDALLATTINEAYRTRVRGVGPALATFRQSPFDLGCSPLYRRTVLRDGTGPA
jgi:hypothetical protein